MPNNPAEFPAEFEGGGGRVPRPGHIAEFPAAGGVTFRAFALEVSRLRNRVHSLESQMLRGFRGEIAEFPEGEGGGGGVRPEIFEIVEIAEFRPGEILEFSGPIAANDFAALRSELQAFEQRITGQIAELKQLIAKQG